MPNIHLRGVQGMYNVANNMGVERFKHLIRKLPLISRSADRINNGSESRKLKGAKALFENTSAYLQQEGVNSLPLKCQRHWRLISLSCGKGEIDGTNYVSLTMDSWLSPMETHLLRIITIFEAGESVILSGDEAIQYGLTARRRRGQYNPTIGTLKWLNREVSSQTRGRQMPNTGL